MGKLRLYNNFINKIMWQKDRLIDARPLLVYCLYNFIYLFIEVIYPVESQ
jgi:hypothetical protein